MKTITLKQAIALLTTATAVRIFQNGHDGWLSYASLQEDTTKIVFDDSEQVPIYCKHKQNQNPKIDNDFLYLIDEDGEELKIQLLMPMRHLPVALKMI